MMIDYELAEYIFINMSEKEIKLLDELIELHDSFSEEHYKLIKYQIILILHRNKIIKEETKNEN